MQRIVPRGTFRLRFRRREPAQSALFAERFELMADGYFFTCASTSSA